MPDALFKKYLYIFFRMNFTYQMRACTFCFLLSSSDRNTSSHLHAHNRSVSKGEAKTYFRALLHCVDTNRKKRKHKIDKWIITTVKMWHDYCVQISLQSSSTQSSGDTLLYWRPQNPNTSTTSTIVHAFALFCIIIFALVAPNWISKNKSVSEQDSKNIPFASAPDCHC